MKPTYEELLKERDEALAYAERLRSASFGMLMNALGTNEWYELESVFRETPPAALAALKAELQAEAVQSILEECEHWSLMGTWGILIDDISEKLEELYQRAQVAE